MGNPGNLSLSNKKKCHELLEASTLFQLKDKLQRKVGLGFTGNQNFLWVGRLNAPKDPMTVINAFEKYIISVLKHDYL